MENLNVVDIKIADKLGKDATGKNLNLIEGEAINYHRDEVVEEEILLKAWNIVNKEAEWLTVLVSSDDDYNTVFCMTDAYTYVYLSQDDNGNFDIIGTCSLND